MTTMENVDALEVRSCHPPQEEASSSPPPTWCRVRGSSGRSQHHDHHQNANEIDKHNNIGKRNNIDTDNRISRRGSAVPGYWGMATTFTGRDVAGRVSRAEEGQSLSATSLTRRMECIARHVASAGDVKRVWRKEEEMVSGSSLVIRRKECIARHVASSSESVADPCQHSHSSNSESPSDDGRSCRLGRRRENHVSEAESKGICFSPEVREALIQGKPVVALESTIIAHGMPYPQNLKTAMEVEDVIRHAGAVPATIAIMEGIPKIGLTTRELERVAKLGKSVMKASRRDVAQVVAQRLNGATTVSATMLLAEAAGIPVFVTGGIGGVHREGESTMDVSADLMELGRTPVAVVCGGVKSILDIPRTLECLETQGVTVVGYGSDEFPAFFTVSSGVRVPFRLDTPEACAALIAANQKLSLGSGILIGVPIPAENAAAGERVEVAINQALAESRRAKMTGNAVTPFLLKRVNELTGGESLTANIALVNNNALVGARIAIALQNILCS